MSLTPEGKREKRGTKSRSAHKTYKKVQAKKTCLIDDLLFLELQKNLGILSEKYRLSKTEVIRSLNEKTQNQFLMPSELFKERKLGVLEIITKFLKEEKELSYHEIAVLLKRNDRTIWTTYNLSKKKLDQRLPRISEAKILVPVNTFSNRTIGCLESLVYYLKKQGYTYHQIAQMINRNDRTIWTSYNKAVQKLEKTSSSDKIPKTANQQPEKQDNMQGGNK